MFAYVVIIKMANNNKVIIIVLYFSSHYTKCTMKTETTQRNNAATLCCAKNKSSLGIVSCNITLKERSYASAISKGERHISGRYSYHTAKLVVSVKKKNYRYGVNID